MAIDPTLFENVDPDMKPIVVALESQIAAQQAEIDELKATSGDDALNAAWLELQAVLFPKVLAANDKPALVRAIIEAVKAL